jgi:CheY-like chemotaxis protein
MARVVVVHFNPPNLDKRLARLSGNDVESLTPKGQADLKPLRESPPDAFVVDLDRRPSEGRSIAVQLRRYASTRNVPIVFAGGEADQVARVQNLLPDATYVPWVAVVTALKRAEALEKPVVPATMDAYSQTELEPKLGVRDGTTVLLLGAPDGFGRALRRAECVETGPAQLVMLFSPSVADLEREFAAASAAIAPGGSIWLCWPKKTSGLQSDLDQASVRRYGMNRGLVDFKVAAIDATWSGLRFARKKH